MVATSRRARRQREFGRSLCRNCLRAPEGVAPASTLPTMKGEPDFLKNLQDEMGGGRQWLDRAIVIVYAVLAGLAVVLLTLLADAAIGVYGSLRSAAWWAPLIWTPAMTALVVWAVRDGRDVAAQMHQYLRARVTAAAAAALEAAYA